MSFRPPSVAAVGAAALLLAALPAIAVAGPPWIAVELPANPLNATTRDAFLLIRTYHHANAVSAPLTGRAIGVVDGKRRTIELTIERTSVPGVYAVRRNWPDEGAWALAIHLGEGTDGAAHANMTEKFVDSMLTFDETVGVALEFAAARNDVLIIVTGDHETGGLQIHAEKGKEMDLRWATKSHTGEAVPIFALGPGAERFGGFMDGEDVGKRIQELLR